MLELPSLLPGGAGNPLNTLIILGWLTATVIGSVIAWRGKKEQQPQQENMESKLANFPMWHFEGPLVKLFEVVNEILARVKRIEERLEELVEIERRRRRS